MKTRSLLGLLVLTAACCQGAQLQEVASFPTQQVTGVGVSKSGRIFVCFPFWSDDHSISVAEIVDGQPKAFPNEEWNKSGGEAGSRFVCVQSTVVDDQDNLWIIDPAAPKTKEIVKGGPKLVKVDLKTNQVVQTIPFGEDVAPAKSYLNDVRVDTGSNTAFITDSGLGAIVVVNLRSGKARRLLADSKSTKVEPGVTITVDGKELIDEEKNKPPQSLPMGSLSIRRTAISIITHLPATRSTGSRRLHEYQPLQERSRLEGREPGPNSFAGRNAGSA